MLCETGRFFYGMLILTALSACKKNESADLRPVSGIFALPATVSLTPVTANSALPDPVKGMIFVPPGPLDITDPIANTALRVYVKGFLMDSTEVTVAEFERFVEETGYKTDAEKFGNAGVFNMDDRTWGLEDGADWRQPRGKTKPEAGKSEPVTQLSWYDARAFCAWQGKRLPHELEWEHAARNGHNDQHLYPWGGDWDSDGHISGNVWQGDFPAVFKNLDGFESTAPVGSFRPSPLGFFDLSGNVWEWCDNWRFEYDQLSRGSFAPSTEKAMRGGSFLCAPNYCHGYKISSRSFTTPETSLFHIGCRCVK